MKVRISWMAGAAALMLAAGVAAPPVRAGTTQIQGYEVSSCPSTATPPPAAPGFVYETVNAHGNPCGSSPVTPTSATAAAIVTGGTALNAITGPVNGGYICNPLSASDENISATEPLYVDPVGAAAVAGNGTTSSLAPGQCYELPAGGVTTNVSVNAATSAHKLNVVVW